MKALQITVIKDQVTLGTVVRATTVTTQELILAVINEGNAARDAQDTTNDCYNLVIETGCLINAGTQWFHFTETGMVDITGTADWCTNTAWFYNREVFDKAINDGLVLEGFNKNTKINSYVKAATQEQAQEQKPEDNGMAGEQGAENAEKIKAGFVQRIINRVFGSKHGKNKEQALKEAEADIDYCAKGAIAIIAALRNYQGTAYLATMLQDLWYKKADSTDIKSLRDMADELSHRVHEEIMFHEMFVKDKSAKDILTLKAMVIAGETKTIKDEDGNDIVVPRTIFDKLLDLLLYTYNQLQGLLKKWSGKNVFLPFRFIVKLVAGFFKLVREVVGSAFYVSNGVVQFFNALGYKVILFVVGVIVHFKQTIANWSKIKDEPAVEPVQAVAPAPAQ